LKAEQRSISELLDYIGIKDGDYKNEETLDFTKFHVALISGENGQGLVLYKGEYVFGGGTIKEVFRNISNK